MSRLVVVSNRLPSMTAPRSGGVEIPAGGLASAIFATLSRSPRSLWVGWNGKVEAGMRTGSLSRRRIGGVDLLGKPLTPGEVEGYYHGYCNLVLWPLLHCFQGRVQSELKREQAYRGVQARFAKLLICLLRPGDRVWVHDYHLLGLARELRRRGPA